MISPLFFNVFMDENTEMLAVTSHILYVGIVLHELLNTDGAVLLMKIPYKKMLYWIIWLKAWLWGKKINQRPRYLCLTGSKEGTISNT